VRDSHISDWVSGDEAIALFEVGALVTGDSHADDDLHVTLAKMTERSASAVRAPRYLVVVRPEPDGELEIHHRGLSEAEAPGLAEQVLSAGIRAR
jgi:hypothetical protein